MASKIIFSSFKTNKINLEDIKTPGLILLAKEPRQVEINLPTIIDLMEKGIKNFKEIEEVYKPFITNGLVNVFMVPIKKREHYYVTLVGLGPEILQDNESFIKSIVFLLKECKSIKKIEGSVFNKLYFEDSLIQREGMYETFWKVKHGAPVAEKNTVQVIKPIVVKWLGCFDRSQTGKEGGE